MALIVPVKNGGPRWLDAISAIQDQSLCPARILVIDSGSTDGSDTAAREAGFEVVAIAPETFDHGGTRQKAIEMVSDCDIAVFLTQDAVLATPNSLEHLVKALLDHPKAGVAYGRQLPREKAGPIERHARLFNYPEKSAEKSLPDLQRLGIKAAFSSNSFAAYRREVLLEAGGFPQKLPLGEDMVAAARILLRGGTVVYAADAHVIHSHGFSLWEEARRYHAIGRMHAGQQALLARFRSPESEGKRFVLSEIAFLARCAPWRIPEAGLRTLTKYAAYRMGRRSCAYNNGAVSERT
ncbi:glycosyltransferase family 2 protein [Acidithiobacillus sp. CV18-2]|nr:glycosyltransferase family 2 protein [Acidithiobacillus sp. CV18-2]MBU2800215.1 glycosyltransferase family 2 protein [Acidithiobacillus sp. VAN18-4]